MSGNKIILKTSITLEYVAEKWGIERIVLDGIQNHLPADSGGTSVKVGYLINEEWVRHDRALGLPPEDRVVGAILFADDGQGFDYRKLGLLYSDKPNGKKDGKPNGKPNGDDSPVAVGQFGEGLKMLTAACLREGMQIQIMSRDWRATPYVEKISLDGKTAHQLVYEVETGLPPIKGSTTMIQDPTKEVVDYVDNIGRKVLHLRPGYVPVYSDQDGNHVVDESGDIFVRGVFITSDKRSELLFGYDLNLDTSRDRDHVNELELGNAIGETIRNCDDRRVIEKILRSAVYKSGELGQSLKNYLEHRCVPYRCESGHYSHSCTPKHPEVWKQVFISIFGDRAVLGTSLEAEKMAQLAGYQVFSCVGGGFIDFLARCGIMKDESVATSDPFLFADLPGNARDIRIGVHETSITLSYRAQKWDKRRMILDALANHMPVDSGGKKISIKYKKGEWGHWVPRDEFDYRERIVGVAIEDDGRGYDDNCLALLTSSKTGTEVGHFGEGMKMLSAACLREGLRVKFRSRDWVATPFSAKRSVDGREVDVLCYRVLRNVPEANGSMTVFGELDAETTDIFRRLDDHVLWMRPGFSGIQSGAAGSMFVESDRRSVKNGSVFNKGFFITGVYSDRLLFSYNLRTNNLSPDRDNVDFEVLKSSVAELVSTCTDREAIARILRSAQKEKDAQYLEFIDVALSDEVAALWKGVFYEVFGKNAVLSTAPYASVDADHLGFTLVELNQNIQSTLSRAGVQTDEAVARIVRSDCVAAGTLTSAELQMIARLPEIDQVLKLTPVPIRVFTQAWAPSGQELGVGGYWDTQNQCVWLRRSSLSDFATAGRIYIHERGHGVTGGLDPEDGFRAFFEYFVSAFVGDSLGRLHADPSYCSGIEAFRAWDHRRLTELQRSERVLQDTVGTRDAEIKRLGARIELLEQQMHQAEQDRSMGLNRACCVSFDFEGRTVHVQPRSMQLDDMSLRRIERALLRKRKGLDRILGFLLGRPDENERQVDVFITKNSPGARRTCSHYSSHGQEHDPFEITFGFPPPKTVAKEEIDRLNDREKVRIMRKITRREQVGGGSITADEAIAKRRRELAKARH